MFLDDYRTGAALAADLVNTVGSISGYDHLEGRATLRSFLEEHDLPAGTITTRDLNDIKDLREKLRAVFLTTSEKARVKMINALLETASPLPRLTGSEDGGWQIKLDPPSRSVVDRLASLTATGLAGVVTELGPDRVGLCEANECLDVYADTSKNGSRRFCDDKCATRTHVAAYRARRKQTL